MLTQKEITEIIMNLQAAMQGAVMVWLAFLKLEDDSRALKTVRGTDFRMNSSVRVLE